MASTIKGRISFWYMCVLFLLKVHLLQPTISRCNYFLLPSPHHTITCTTDTSLQQPARANHRLCTPTMVILTLIQRTVSKYFFFVLSCFVSFLTGIWDKVKCYEHKELNVHTTDKHILIKVSREMNVANIGA